MSAYRVHRWQHTIEWGECDAAGIVFYPRYFELFDWSAWLMFEDALGVPARDIRAKFEIAGFPLVETKTKFSMPCKFGDTVEIASQITDFGRSSFHTVYRLIKAGVLAVETEETRVWIGADLKSKPIPAEVIERFRAV